MGARCGLPSTAWLKLRALDELVPGADVYTGIGPAEGGRKASLHGFAEPPGILEEGPIWTVGRDRTASIGGPWISTARSPRFLRPVRGLPDESLMIHTLAVTAMHRRGRKAANRIFD